MSDDEHVVFTTDVGNGIEDKDKSVSEIIDEREKTHGDFRAMSGTNIQIQNAIEKGEGYKWLNASQLTSLQMIAVKIARIVNGDPNHIDSWDDIAGYATLVSKEIKAYNEAE